MIFCVHGFPRDTLVPVCPKCSEDRNDAPDLLDLIGDVDLEREAGIDEFVRWRREMIERTEEAR